MPWKYDPQLMDLVFVIDTNVPIISGVVSFGDISDGDLSIDTGNRENDSSIVDSGLRVVDGSI